MKFIPSKQITKIFTRKRSLIIVKAAFFTYLFFSSFSVDIFSAETSFFSYKRFFIREGAISGKKGQGLIQRDLETFVRKFNEGLYYFSSDKYLKAEKSLQKARQLWPEYYATDFLLAQAYEKTGKEKIASRYYKSYLVKLRKLRNGSYRLTGPLMISLNARGIEDYDDAYSYVKNRLNARGIDIDKVFPAFDPSGEFIFLFVGISGIAGMFFIYNKLRPYWRKRKRIMSVPEGFWACHNCGTYNPKLRHECEECGWRNPEK